MPEGACPGAGAARAQKKKNAVRLWERCHLHHPATNFREANGQLPGYGFRRTRSDTSKTAGHNGMYSGCVSQERENQSPETTGMDEDSVRIVYDVRAIT